MLINTRQLHQISIKLQHIPRIAQLQMRGNNTNQKLQWQSHLLPTLLPLLLISLIKQIKPFLHKAKDRIRTDHSKSDLINFPSLQKRPVAHIIRQNMP